MTSPAAARTAKDGTRVYPITVDGKVLELPSVNTVNKVLDAPGLNIWKQRTLARAMASYDDLRKRIALSGDNRTIDAVVREALDRDNTAAQRGTDVHSWTERLDDGTATLNDVPMDLRGYCAAYELCKREHDISTVLMERTVFNVNHGYAGTFDRIQTSPTWGDVPVITDIKTGKNIYPEVALQLAAYAYAEAMWNPDTQAAEHLPRNLSRTLAVVIHLAPDHYELVPVDIASAWPSLIAVAQAWQWRARTAKRNNGVIGAPYPTPLDPDELV